MKNRTEVRSWETGDRRQEAGVRKPEGQKTRRQLWKAGGSPNKRSHVSISRF